MTERDVITFSATNPDVFVLHKNGSFTPRCFVQDDTGVSAQTPCTSHTAFFFYSAFYLSFDLFLVILSDSEESIKGEAGEWMLHFILCRSA
ncbi:MAG: hypothetical protein HGB20_01990 [Chlorobiaceae bacterium]|nr:hypothetical protein [Chlorobiaceae bacterium]